MIIAVVLIAGVAGLGYVAVDFLGPRGITQAPPPVSTSSKTETRAVVIASPKADASRLSVPNEIAAEALRRALTLRIQEEQPPSLPPPLPLPRPRPIARPR
jgi:hypothetical protein